MKKTEVYATINNGIDETKHDMQTLSAAVCSYRTRTIIIVEQSTARITRAGDATVALREYGGGRSHSSN